ncbi:MAG: tRNA (adenosine(37)-N6)-threonylcarbamoyltransferase complex transferase subunit TsaD [Oscillospiraceae bacterium]|nr:tRNA (adenosine(37)-N6)-threonylcarbamoyltransferase complex transferase subunit TsaD [Oscillospiraceae bacterium]
MYILGIESSCDDTAAAVVRDGRELASSCIATSADEQNLYGGVVPEIASRRHIEHISGVCGRALREAGIGMQDIDAVAATFAPGLIGAVLVGLNFAKGLAYAAQKPLVPVHHLRGHIAALYLTYPQLKPPFLCLVASGGHSHIVMVRDYVRFEVLGRTVDDAAGEAFDKVARTLGLGYPGGPLVSREAQKGDPAAYRLPTPKVEGRYNVSFSGLKTAVLNVVNQAKMKGEAVSTPDMCASFEHKITDILAEKLLLAARDHGAKKICVAGGVAANTKLRETLQAGADKLSAQLYLPLPALCGDNAAMIAAQGYYELQNGNTAGLDLNGLPTLGIDYEPAALRDGALRDKE